MIRRFLTLLALILICFGGLYSQESVALSPAEKTILSLISSDSLSRTVTYFFRQMKFGIADQDNRYLVLVKNGKDNFFLLEGTNRVYRLENGKNGPILVRQDKTTNEGDNFLMMAFMRKDTLFQYGGYGFWKVRDFFTYYVPGIREWEFLSGGQPLESMNSWHYYDPGADRFYLIGRHTMNPHLGDNLFIYDSVYAFDFTTRRVSVIGTTVKSLNRRSEYQVSLGTMSSAPFGLIMAWARQLKLVDCGQNRIYDITGPKRDTIDQAFRAWDSAGMQLTMMYLRDTMYWISGNGQKASVQKLALTKEDFDTRSGTPLYEPINGRTKQSLQASTSSGLSYPWVLLLVLGASTAAYLAGRRLMGTRKDNPAVRITEQLKSTGNLYPDPDTPASTARDDGFVFFLQHLSPVEADLLKEMVRYSLQDRKMETDAINKILGVYNKDPEIQKARRSNAITHINNTFTQTTRRNGLLIQRERDEIDKRVYVYFIPHDLARSISDGWNGLREQ